MKLIISQAPEKGVLGGPKGKHFTFSDKDYDYEITVEQCGNRQITISSSNTIENLLHIFYSLDTLLMLLDGQFYPINQVLENDQSVTYSFQKRALPSFKSADFMIGAGNILISFENVLSADLLGKWISLRTQLDMIHNMMLYCVSSVQMPVDMKCAFMIESFLGIGELVNEIKKDYTLPSVPKGESKLKQYLITIIEHYGQDIFHVECLNGKEQLAQILTNSRNRIAHIKIKQNRNYLDGKECVLYLMKLSLLYRIILFDLLGVPEECYKEEIQARTNELNEYEGIMQDFLKKMTDG